MSIDNVHHCISTATCQNLKMIAAKARIDILESVYSAQSGHLGGFFPLWNC